MVHLSSLVGPLKTKVTNITLALLLVLGSLPASLLFSQPVYAASTLQVNGAAGVDSGDCISTACATINYAIGQATAGDTINIAAETYNEQVVIDGKNLTLNGVGDGTLIRPSSQTVLTEFYTYPVGVLSGWAGLKLASPILVKNSANVTIQNLRVDGINASSLPTGADRLSGIVYGEAGGLISNVTVNNIKTPDYSVRTYSIDVSSVTAPLNVEIANSRVNDFSRTAIQAQGANLTANIHDNVVIGPGFIGPANVPNGIVLIAGATGIVDDNTISANHYTGSSFLGSGILLYQAGASVTVSYNRVFDVDDAVLIAGTASATISNNNLYDNVKGIQIEQAGAINNTFTDNTISDNTYGVFLASSAGAGNAVNLNSITGSVTAAVNNESSNLFNAANNYWGSAIASTVASQMTGTGAITYLPYYVDADLTYLNTDTPTSTYVSPLYTDGNAGNHSFGWDAFNTIQEGINAVAAGPANTVTVATETYEEQITVDKALTLQGAGDNAVTGTVIGTTGGGSLVTITANGVSLRDLRIDRQGAGNGISVSGSTVSNLTLAGITATGAIGTLVSPGTGLRVGTGTTIDGFTVTDSHFDGNDIGWYLAKESANSTTITDVSVTNTSFNNNGMKGLYAEKLDNAVFDDIEVINSGIAAGYGFNAGIDINLKWSTYSNIEILNSTVTGSGLMGSATNQLFPVGITIKARNDAPSYVSPAATLNGVTISNVTVSGGVNGLRFGEPGKNNVGPTGVIVNDSRLSGNSAKSLINETQTAVSASGNWWGSNLGPSAGQISGSVTADTWCASSACTSPFLSASTGTVTLPAGEATQVSSTPVSPGTLVTLPGSNDVTATDATGTISVTISAGTVITPTGGIWNGQINSPAIRAPSTVSVPTPDGFTTAVATVIEVGSNDVTLTFDSPVRLLIPDQAGSRVGFIPAGSTTFTEITTSCGLLDDPTIVAAVLLATGQNECKMDVGDDLVVWTKHFTKFIAYSQAASSSDSSGGSSDTEGTGSTTTSSSDGTAEQPTVVATTTPDVTSTQGASDIARPPVAQTKPVLDIATGKFLGLMWYWWLLIALAGAAGMYGVYRYADTPSRK
ncbi:MAG: right-handed parallel beta-helix repeat-containing protein [Candidatus Saccharimonadales bacterium]